jgi:sec-independent protein translocase protein TatB
MKKEVLMLNLGLGEILIFSVLALVVVGPERLPTMVRFMGRQYGKLMRASRELRRAFYMEAERVESTERREKLKKAREEVATRQKELIKQHKLDPDNPPDGVSQDIEGTSRTPTPHVSTPQEEDDLPPEPTPDPFIPFDHEEAEIAEEEFVPFDHEESSEPTPPEDDHGLE